MYCSDSLMLAWSISLPFQLCFAILGAKLLAWRIDDLFDNDDDDNGPPAFT